MPEYALPSAVRIGQEADRGDKQEKENRDDGNAPTDNPRGDGADDATHFLAAQFNPVVGVPILFHSTNSPIPVGSSLS